VKQKRSMGTHIDINNLGGDTSRGNESKPLARQSSLYSLTFDELQSTLGEPGKDFGSMNMDELLKNIWTAEDTQAFMTTTSSVAAPGPSGFVPGGNGLQRQGSLTLPRTLSQKTVDEVWKYLNSKEGSNGNTGTDALERQQTLGEMTLEDFLLRAGVVKEDNTQQNENSSSGFYANNGAAGLEFGFGQPNQNSISFNGNNSSMIMNQAPGLGLKVGGTMQQQQQPHQQQLQQPHQRLPPTIFPKQANVTFAAPVNMVNRGLFETSADGPANSNMGGAGGTVTATSPGTSSAENNTWSSPVPYVFGRGRRSNTGLEKVVERRQKRMIKNRESAARSRARKQAYTLELEAEIESLKLVNQDLQKKQAEIMKTHNSELKEFSKQPPLLAKRQCLRRTLTGPW